MMDTALQPEAESFWRLCFRRPTEVLGRPLSQHLNSLADIEALLWLHFGVELGLYSSDIANLIVSSNRKRLSSSSRAVRKLGVSHFFSSEVRTFLDQARELTSISDIRYTSRLAKDLVNPLSLGMLFHEIAESFNDPVLLLFTDLITFEGDDTWNRLVETDPNPENIIKNEGEPKDLLFSGFLAFLEHMNSARELLLYCHDESASDHARFELTHRLRSIHMWRLNLAEADVKNRFTQLTSEFLLQLNWDPELEYLDFDSAELVKRIEWICASWTGADSFPLGLHPERPPRRRTGTG